MIQGMTGFGSAAFSFGEVKGEVEIKSQNHRYLDLVYYLPTGFGAFENKIRQLVSKQILRGRVTVVIKIKEKPSQEVVINKSVIQKYLKQANSLKKEFGFDDSLRLADVIRLPGVVESHESLVEADKLWPTVEKALQRALQSLITMRNREGKSLSSDFIGILKNMVIQVKRVQERLRAVVKEKEKILSGDELFSFKKGCDVSEEMTRLTHYVEEFRLLLKTKEDVGKKLDFVAQEMQRETNTIGSKLQDKDVASAVVALKSKIEKLREQAQNIE
ncbi:MAG: YicC family protein [Candidatus Omnitrophica bacterium]|nr:YicC family protein [Candidatus Omnitrophota bacterium]